MRRTGPSSARRRPQPQLATGPSRSWRSYVMIRGAILSETDDRIPIVETYRGVGIHNEQPRKRIERVVKPEIDRVFDELHGVRELFEFAKSAANSPEARMLAG